MAGDPPVAAVLADLARPQRCRAPGFVGGFSQETQGSKATGTGAHGQEWRDGKLVCRALRARSAASIQTGGADKVF
jgi:hypothetical protein